MLTDTHLSLIMPRLSAAQRQLYLPVLVQTMQGYDINVYLRAAAFLAQLAHESAEFRWMEEIWGPTDAQRRYEPPADLARRLGNTQPGDGQRYKGRGPIQITGRANYKRYGDLLGLDLVGQPELAATPAVAFSVAGLYWRSNGLNALADKEDFVGLTRRINGGTNGLADRQQYYERAKAVLGLGFTLAADAPVPVSRGAKGARGAPPVRIPLPIKRSRGPLRRGFEGEGEGEVEVVPTTAVPKKAASKRVAKKGKPATR